MIKVYPIYILFFSFFLFSCENDIPEEEDVFDNPLDEEVVEYELPALTIYPAQTDATVNNNFKIEIFAMGIENLAGTHVRLNYEKTMFQVSVAQMGAFFSDAEQDPVFVYEDNSQDGWVDIHTSFLGSDSVSVSGTGSLAEIIFTSILPGESTLTFDAVCELVDPDDNPIEIKGFGEGVVNAQ